MNRFQAGDREFRRPGKNDVQIENLERHALLLLQLFVDTLLLER